MSDANPYASAETVPDAPRGRFDRPLRLCIVMFGLSWFFCFLRIPFLALDLNEALGGGMGSDPALAVTTVPAIAASIGIVLFGLAGNTLLLARIRWGIPLAVLLVVSTSVSIGVEAWVAVLARSLASYRGGVLHDVVDVAVIALRITLLGLYLAALGAFIRWTSQTG